MNIENHFSEIQRLSPSGYALGLHLSQGLPRAARVAYPQGWIETYTANVYQMHDPVVIWGMSTEGWIRWSDIDIPDPEGILARARSFGLHHGVAVSCGSIRSRSIAGFARADRAFDDGEARSLEAIVRRLHGASDPESGLTEGQCEALILVTSGRRIKQIAGDLGISESAVKARLSGARRRLGARTLSEAISAATCLGLLSGR